MTCGVRPRPQARTIAALDEEDRAAARAAITTIRTQRAQLAVSFPAELTSTVAQNTPVFFPTIERAAHLQAGNG